MSSWGYNADLPLDFYKQDAVSAAVVGAIEQVHGTKFKHGSVYNTIYAASGVSLDYAYGVCGIKYSFSAELRDQVCQ